ncbi:MAG: tryptophan synthase subunit alpha [Pseudomonadota bacterium]
MSRIQSSFEQLARNGRKALIPFVTAGDPEPGMTVALMHALVEAGADVVELGVPFSDPMADGPVVQRASDRALLHGVGLDRVLAFVREFRAKNQNTPVVLMGYANPIEAMGVARYVEEARRAGVDGTLVVDYPPEECESFAGLVRSHGMDLIFLLAPTSSDARIAKVARLASGYLYYVSLKGVTGAGNLVLSEVGEKILRIRRATKLPVGVGFGIRDAATAKAVAAFADAVIIGSAIIQEMETAPAGEQLRAAARFLQGIRAALDAA